MTVEHFTLWNGHYNGPLYLARDADAAGVKMESQIYGFETFTDETHTVGVVPEGGAVYGYVTEGAVTVWDSENRSEGFVLRTGRWFSLPDGARLHLHPRTRVVAIQRVGYRVPRSFGGPIEAAGRLRYIDGCSDSLLVCPPLLGDPCLNHLHFPPGIEQTMHTHPSVRAGAVARGSGWCETPATQGAPVALRPGMIWMIPAGCEHRFITTDDELDVIAYHPDSDWGPTDVEHPMVNRTWVDGAKIDNTAAVHQSASVIGRT